MNRNSSGCYIVDHEFNVINLNETAAALYPQLKIGKKCYKCLMDLDEPCGPCPVVNGVKGPTTYRDPIRNIAEVVDAVDIDLEHHGRCHMLVFSTVEDEAEFAATLPTSAEELKRLALIKALTENYQDVYSVNLTTDDLTLYRHDGKAQDANSIYRKITSYRTGTERYIEQYVLPEDREMMREKSSAEHIREVLRENESYVIHYRVLLNGETHNYYRKIVRIGERDTFDHVVIGVGCEDDEIRIREEQVMLQQDLRKVEYSTSTGLLTKEAFFIYGERLRQAYPDTEHDFCIMRIDNMGSINHQYSRVAGDKVIQMVGEILKTYETEENCIAYLGDGMFGSITPNTDDGKRRSDVEAFRDRIIAESDVKNLVMKWSIIKNITRDEPLDMIYEKFNYAIATVRGNINREYVEMDMEMLKKIEWDLSVERAFKQALKDGEFIAWYQPKYDVRTQSIIGAEALVRWQKPDGELIPPAKFIPVLENRGLINLLDREVFRMVCRLQKRMREAGMTPLPISVNLSRASIFTDDIADVYSQIAAEYGVDPGLVPIEITESAAVRANMIVDFTQSLIDKGFVLHMDDFGAGYSSLVSLQALPFECIKLDKTLIDFIGRPSGESLLKHTIAFACENRMQVVAEGVENLEQYLFLKVAGCSAIQGYYFSKPLCEQDFLKAIQ